MAKHSPRFLQLAEDARRKVLEISIDEVRTAIDGGDAFILVDVREESEWAADHLPGAVHMSRGTIERDIEQRFPSIDTPFVLYCGGGYRSALSAASLEQMGYTNVRSMAGGIRAWREAGYELQR